MRLRVVVHHHDADRRRRCRIVGRAAGQTILEVEQLVRDLAQLAQELLVRLGDLFQQTVAIGGRLDVARRLDHPLAQVGDDVRLLEDDVGGAGAERLDRGLVRLAGGHHHHRGERRLVARELQELDPPARRGCVGVDQRDRVELVQELIARPHRIVRAGHDQPDLGQQPVEALDDLLVGVDDQDLLSGGGGLIGHVGINLTWNARMGSRPHELVLLTQLGDARGPPTWIRSSTERCRGAPPGRLGRPPQTGAGAGPAHRRASCAR